MDPLDQVSIFFFRNEIKHHEEDRTAEKVLHPSARSPALRDEGRAEPLMDLTRTLKNPSKTSIFSKYESYPSHVKWPHF